MIESQYKRALQILTENKDKLTLLAEKLLTSEVIFKEDLIDIFGKRAWEKEDDTVVEAIVHEDTNEEIMVEHAASEPSISEEKVEAEESKVEETNADEVKIEKLKTSEDDESSDETEK